MYSSTLKKEVKKIKSWLQKRDLCYLLLIIITKKLAAQGEFKMGKSKVAAFIDLANINCGFDTIKSSRRMPHLRLDFDKIINMLAMGSEIASKNIYTERRVDAQEQGKKQKFMDFLTITGFNVVSKECKVISSSDGDKNKANFDVEIAVDICRCIWRRDCNEIILFSGDSDFVYLLDEAKNYNITVIVVSTKSTISRELRERADKVILLDEIKDITQFTNTK